MCETDCNHPQQAPSADFSIAALHAFACPDGNMKFSIASIEGDKDSLSVQMLRQILKLFTTYSSLSAQGKEIVDNAFINASIHTYAENLPKEPAEQKV